MDTLVTTYRKSCQSLTWLDILKRAIIVVVAWVIQSLMLFQMNFMLASFQDSRKNSYTTLITMALLFLAFTILLLAAMFLLSHVSKHFESGKLAFRNLFTRTHLVQLVLLGLFDCLGGITGTYAAPSTPIAVQFTILSTSVAWTFLFARWLVPDRERPCTPLVFFSTTLTILGACITIIPQWKSMEDLHGVASTLGWIFIFTLAALFPLFLNVLYARYLVSTVDAMGRSVVVVDAGHVTIGGGGLLLIDHPTGNNKDNLRSNNTSMVASEDNNNNNSTENFEENGNDDHDVTNNKALLPEKGAIAIDDVDGRARNRKRNNHHKESSPFSSSSSSSSVPAGSSSSSPAAAAASSSSFGALESSPTLRQEVCVIASHNWSYFLCKLSIAMFGDALFQVIFCVVFFPLDFAPWFGAAANATESMQWLETGFKEVYQGASYVIPTDNAYLLNDGASTNTPVYFVLYTVGFFGSHMIGASLSYYSPQLTAFIYSVNTPINLILLALIPSWNVFGQVAPIWASVTSIVFTAVGALTYAMWEHLQRMKERAKRDAEEKRRREIITSLVPVDEEVAINLSKQNLSLTKSSNKNNNKNNRVDDDDDDDDQKNQN